MQDQLTVLVPTRNRATDLRQALGRARDCGLHELRHMIYDDASDEPEQTVDASRVLPSVRVLMGQPRLGPAAGRNQLLRACETPYALLMDDDTWFTRASALPEILERDLEFAGVGRASAICSQVFRTSDGATIFPEQLPQGRIVNPLGAGCLVRVADVLRIGGFRDYWRYRHEETELGLRMWKHDLKVVYEPALVVEHGHTRAARSSREYDHNSARNTILMHALNLPGWAGFPTGLLRALRLLLTSGSSRGATVAGILEGVLDRIRYRADIRPMTRSRYRELRDFQSELRRRCGEAG